MLVYELLAPGGAHEVIAAILAAATVAADERNHIAVALDLQSVARLLHDLTDEVLLLPRLIGMTHLPSLARIARLDGIGFKFHGIREDNQAPQACGDISWGGNGRVSGSVLTFCF